MARRLPVRDDAGVLRRALLECARDCDAIIASGGVSAGDFDPVRDVLPSVVDVHFWEIAMKLGKPVMFATMRSPDDEAEAAAHEYSCAAPTPPRAAELPHKNSADAA